MAQWGTGDDHANSVSYAPQQYKKEATPANQQALYGNTTADAFVTGATVGQFAVDTNEIAASGAENKLIQVGFYKQLDQAEELVELLLKF